MIIVGAKGFAKEVLDVIIQGLPIVDIVFYDDFDKNIQILFDKYRVLKNQSEAKEYFELYEPSFTVGIGGPWKRYMMSQKFLSLGGVFRSSISKFAIIGKHEVMIGEGCNILPNAIISSSTSVGKGCLIYYNSVITHDCIIGDFVEISPSANLLGRCHIGSFSHIGANATILPDIRVGMNVIVGAGAVVTKDIPDNSVVTGIPARVTKTLPPLNFNS